jgi:hypothetical protein
MMRRRLLAVPVLIRSLTACATVGRVQEGAELLWRESDPVEWVGIVVMALLGAYVLYSVAEEAFFDDDKNVSIGGQGPCVFRDPRCETDYRSPYCCW